MSGEGLDEVVVAGTQEHSFAKAYFGDAGSEEVRGVEEGEVLVQTLVLCHGGHDAYAHSKADIGLDDIGVGGGEHHVGHEPMALEGLIDMGAVGETEDVGEDGISGNGFERQGLDRFKRMTARYHDRAVPAVAG